MPFNQAYYIIYIMSIFATQLLLLLFLGEVAGLKYSQDCYKEPYPKVIGVQALESAPRELKFSSMDFNPNYNRFAVGGRTTVQKIYQATSPAADAANLESGRPIVAQYEVVYDTMMWLKYIDSPNQQVAAMKYQDNGQKLAVMTQQVTFFEGASLTERCLYLINSHDGSLHKAQCIQQGGDPQNGNQFMIVTNSNMFYLLLGNYYSAGKFYSIVFHLNIDPVSSYNWHKMQSGLSFIAKGLHYTGSSLIALNYEATDIHVTTFYNANPNNSPPMLSSQTDFTYKTNGGERQKSGVYSKSATNTTLVVIDFQLDCMRIVIINLTTYIEMPVIKTYTLAHSPGITYEEVLDILVMETKLRFLRREDRNNPDKNRLAFFQSDFSAFQVYQVTYFDLGVGINLYAGKLKDEGYFYIAGTVVSTYTFDPSYIQTDSQGFIAQSDNKYSCYNLETYVNSGSYTQVATPVDQYTYSSMANQFASESGQSFNLPTAGAQTQMYEVSHALLIDYTQTACTSQPVTISKNPNPLNPGGCEIEYFQGTSSTQQKQIQYLQATYNGGANQCDPSTLKNDYTVASSNQIYTFLLINEANYMTLSIDVTPSGKTDLSVKVSKNYGQVNASATFNVCMCPDLSNGQLTTPIWYIQVGSTQNYQFELEMALFNLYEQQVIPVNVQPSSQFMGHNYVPKLILKYAPTSTQGLIPQITVTFDLQSKGCTPVSGFSVIVKFTKPDKECFGSTFPKIFACPESLGEAVELTALDESINGYLAVGGSANEQCLFSSSPGNPQQPFIAVYYNDLIWAKRYTDSQYFMVQLDFTLYGTHLGVMLKNSNYMYFVMIEALTGDTKRVARVTDTLALFGESVLTKNFIAPDQSLMVAAYIKDKKPYIYKVYHDFTSQIFTFSQVIDTKDFLFGFRFHETQQTYAWLLTLTLDDKVQIIRMYPSGGSSYQTKEIIINDPVLPNIQPLLALKENPGSNPHVITVAMNSYLSLFFCSFNEGSQKCQESWYLQQAADLGVSRILDAKIVSTQNYFVLTLGESPYIQPILYRFITKVGGTWHSIRFQFVTAFFTGPNWLGGGEVFTQAKLSDVGTQISQFHFTMKKSFFSMQSSYKNISSGMSTGNAGMLFSTQYSNLCETIDYLVSSESQGPVNEIETSSMISYSTQTSSMIDLQQAMNVTESYRTQFLPVEGDYFNEGGGLVCDSDIPWGQIQVYATQSAQSFGLKYSANSLYQIPFANFSLGCNDMASFQCTNRQGDEFTYELQQDQGAFYGAPDAGIYLNQTTGLIEIQSPLPDVSFVFLLTGTFTKDPSISKGIPFSFIAIQGAVASGNQGAPKFSDYGILHTVTVAAKSSNNINLPQVVNPNGVATTVEYRTSIKARTESQLTVNYQHHMTTPNIVISVAGQAYLAEFEVVEYNITLFSTVQAVTLSVTYQFFISVQLPILEQNDQESLQEPIPALYYCPTGDTVLNSIDIKGNFVVVGGHITKTCLGFSSSDTYPMVMVQRMPSYEVEWQKYIELSGYSALEGVFNEQESSIATILFLPLATPPSDYILIFINRLQGDIASSFTLDPSIFNEFNGIDSDWSQPKRLLFCDNDILYIGYTNSVANLLSFKTNPTNVMKGKVSGNSKYRGMYQHEGHLYFVYEKGGFTHIHLIKENQPLFSYPTISDTLTNHQLFANSIFIAIVYLKDHNTFTDIFFFDSFDTVSSNVRFQLFLSPNKDPRLLAISGTPQSLTLLLKLNSYLTARDVTIVTVSLTSPYKIVKLRESRQVQWDNVRRGQLFGDAQYLIISTEARVVVANASGDKVVSSGSTGVLMVRQEGVGCVYQREMIKGESSVSDISGIFVIAGGAETLAFTQLIYDEGLLYNTVDFPSPLNFILNSVDGFHKMQPLTVHIPSYADLTLDFTNDYENTQYQATLQPFQPTPSCMKPPCMTYELSTANASCISFDANTLIISVEGCREEFETDAKLKGWFQGRSEAYEGIPFRVRVKGNMGAPRFNGEIAENIIIQAGGSYDLILPQIVDPDNDEYFISLSLQTKKLQAIFEGNILTIKASYQNTLKSLQTYKLLLIPQDIPVDGISLSSTYFITVRVNYTHKFEEVVQESIKYEEEQIQEVRKDNQRLEYLRSNQNELVKFFEMVNLTLIEQNMTQEQYQKWCQREKQLRKIPLNDIKVAFKLTKLSPTGQLTIKFNFISQTLLQLVANGLLEISLSSNFDSLQYQLQYEEPTLLSLGQSRDLLSVTVQQSLTLIMNGMNITLEKGQNGLTTVPPYIVEGQQQAVEQIESAFKTASYVFVTGNALLNVLVQGLMAQLWGIMNNMANLTILSLISVNIPGPARLIGRTLISFSQFDIFPTDYFFTNLLQLQFTDQNALNSQLGDLGFNNISTTMNMGSALVYSLIEISLYLILMIIGRVKFLSKWHLKLKEKLVWGLPIRLVTSQYVTFYISSLIYLYNIQTSTNSGDLLDLALCIVWFVVCTLFPLFSIRFIHKHFKSIESQTFQSRFGIFTENISTMSLSKALFNCIDILKLQITILILLKLESHPSLQINFLYFQSIIFQAYIMYVKPFPEKAQNYMQLVNESLVTLYLLTMIILTDYVEQYEFKYISGIILIGIYGISFIVNFFTYVIESVKNIIKRLNTNKRKQNYVSEVRKEPPILIEIVERSKVIIEDAIEKKQSKKLLEAQSRRRLFPRRQVSEDADKTQQPL
ncbi:hypothetical protein FGO68_gene17242 [Halteria grandinella]|uniref:Uncharacterized protein n=1 Tax=Halteria grandinella TaxID=5974 RepID=A0A8J8T9X7_HALGN|nr:hypothetical protein FGO68_gene17242 [Halteria grandinella]